MANNYVLLERIELNSATNSITFTNIPQTGYTDLKLEMSIRTDRADYGDNVGLRFNSVTSGYSDKRLYGYGTGVGSDSGSSTFLRCARVDAALNTANTFSNGSIYIPNYTSSNYKSLEIDSVYENNAAGNAYCEMYAGLWSNTSAVTSITLYLVDSGALNFIAGCTFSLYGIANASTTPAIAPKADGGNVIATDGTYWYHAFLSNGTFTPQVGLSADVLVVAGGGGGGELGGGGGAGGLLAFTSQSLANATNYTCTIGAGGAGQAGANGSNGVNSTFNALTACVGGGGGGRYDQAGSSGGSGGGGGRGSGAGGSATSGQGYAGGTGSSNAYGGAGGGGAGGIGGSSNGSSGGTGGSAVNTYSSWLSATALGVSGYIAGGGGGGYYYSAGGAGGGGGAGAGSAGGVQGGDATANTGSGGGGNGGASVRGGNGGSGIIIIRYPIAS